MPNPNVSLRQTDLILPGAYSVIDASAMVSATRGLGNVIVLIGQATGGPPGVVQYYRSGNDIKRAYRSGDVVDAARFTYDPYANSDLGGADLVAVVRVNPATQSTLSLAGATGTPLVITSRDYGLWTTGIQVKVEAGSTSGKKLTIQYVDPVQGTLLEVYDNQASSTTLVAAINSGVSGGQSASQFVTAAAGTGTEPLTNAAYTNLAGGVEGSTTSTQWTNALNALQLEDVDILVPLTTDTTVHAQVNAHVASMSSIVNRKERVALVGSTSQGFATTDLYVADAVTQATTNNSSRVVNVAPGIKRPDVNGVLASYGPQFLAATLAGIVAALDPGQAATHKYIKAVGLDTQFTRGQLQTLILGGVAPVEFVRNQGFRIVQAITSYQTDANPVYRELSVRKVADLVMQTLRTRYENEFIGVRGDNSTLTSLLNRTISTLNDFVSDGTITAFRNVTITINQGVARIQFEFAPAEPINFVLVTGYAKPASLSVSFTGQVQYGGATAP